MLEFFNKIIYTLEFAGDVYLLRAVGYALATLDAVVCLTEARHAAVIANQEGTPCLLIVLCLLAFWNIALVDTFIIVYENAWDVEAIGAGHTVFAVIAVDGGIALDE